MASSKVIDVTTRIKRKNDPLFDRVYSILSKAYSDEPLTPDEEAGIEGKCRRLLVKESPA